MSQNKTRFPGMEDSDQSKSSASGSIYSRGGYAGGKKERMTQIPGLTHDIQEVKPALPSLIGKPIRGFLYSISRGLVGEATVSEEHASITMRILETQGKTIASLKDTDSTNGTKINGADVDFDANAIKNGDIIRFGLNYECLLILIDTKEAGLKVAKDFLPIDESSMQDDSAPIFYERGKSATGTIIMDEKPLAGSDSHHTVLM